MDGHSPTTFLLIHGAGDAASSWDLLAAELRRRGHLVIAVDLPCDDESAGLSEYADAVVNAVTDRRSAELVVVAHSLGAFTAPLICDRVDVSLILLVAGMIPAPGERGSDWWENTGHAEAVAGRGDDSDMAVYFHDVPEEVAAAAIANTRPQANTPMREPWPLAAWPDVRTRYILCRDDRAFPADWAHRLVRERLDMTPDEINGGHLPFLSRPAELAERLEGCLAESDEG